MEADVRSLHSLVVQRSQAEIAGRYADLPRYVRTETGRHAFPPAVEVAAARSGYGGDCVHGASPTGGYSPVHRWYGRTARLLMNLNLIRGGYPPIAVRPEDRLRYICVLQQPQAWEGLETFDRLAE